MVANEARRGQLSGMGVPQVECLLALKPPLHLMIGACKANSTCTPHTNAALAFTASGTAYGSAVATGMCAKALGVPLAPSIAARPCTNNDVCARAAKTKAARRRVRVNGVAQAKEATQQGRRGRR